MYFKGDKIASWCMIDPRKSHEATPAQ